MAQFTTVDELQSMQSSLDNLTNAVQAANLGSQLSEGSSLIGKTVSGVDPTSGNTVSGVVTGVKVDSGQVVLEPLALPISSVNEIT